MNTQNSHSILYALEKITDIFCIGFLWLLCSLPLVTIGASTTALYHVVYKVLRKDQGHIVKEFFSSFCSNFKQSSILWLIIVLLSFLLGLDLYWGYQISNIWGKNNWIFIPIFILAAITLLCSIYLFPYIARFQDSTKQTLKNVILICLFHLPYSILMLLFLFAAIAICLIVPIGLICVPPLYMLIISFVLEHIFQKYTTNELKGTL